MLSYYDIYMAANPNDKLEILIPQLIKDFANDIKTQNFNFLDFIENDKINQDKLDVALYALKCHYNWHKIKADVYKHIITRSTLISQIQNNIVFDNIYPNISRRVLEECLDIICHNINILEANRTIRVICTNNFELNRCSTFDKFNKKFIPTFDKIIDKLFNINISDDIKKRLIFMVYAAWASYGKGRFEKFVCDSDFGFIKIKQILDEYRYNISNLELVALINRIIDVVHMRNDLANAFVEGGSKTCLIISNLKF